MPALRPAGPSTDAAGREALLRHGVRGGGGGTPPPPRQGGRPPRARLDEVRRAVAALRDLQKRILRRSRGKLSDREVRSAIEEGRQRSLSRACRRWPRPTNSRSTTLRTSSWPSDGSSP